MYTFLSILSKIKRHTISMYVSFFLIKDNKGLFTSLSTELSKKYSERHNQYDYEEFLMPDWKKNTEEIESIFLSGLPFSFLRNQILKQTMFAHLPKKSTNIQKKLISQKYNEEDAGVILREHDTGSPILNDFQYKTSGNSIHHLYHLLKFNQETGVSPTAVNSVMEFGGGYGNMAKIFKKINPIATYTIVDIPVFSYIQFVYLGTVLGKDNVVMFDGVGSIKQGKINIVPLHKAFIEKLSSIVEKPDLFISTWALSETNEATQNMVRAEDYFESKYLLLAYQKKSEAFAYAQDIEKLPQNYQSVYGAETEYLKDNYYLFASRK